MPASKDHPSPGLLDKRVVARNLKKGLVSAEAHEKYLRSLPDLENQAEPIQVQLGSDETTSAAES